MIRIPTKETLILRIIGFKISDVLGLKIWPHQLRGECDLELAVQPLSVKGEPCHPCTVVLKRLSKIMLSHCLVLYA